MKPEVGDVVRISGNDWYTGCLMVVDEVRTWGVIGNVITHIGAAPLRVSFAEIEAVYRKVEGNHGTTH